MYINDPPFAGTTAGTQPKCGNGGVSDAVTSELGDRQSSHPVKNPASIFWQVFRGVARCCLPRFQGQLQHLKYQNRILKKICCLTALTLLSISSTTVVSHLVNRVDTKNKKNEICTTRYITYVTFQLQKQTLVYTTTQS